MVANVKVALIEVLRELVDQLPFGVMITRNDKSIVLSNRFLTEIFSEESCKLQLMKLINKSLVPSVNTPFCLNNRKGIIRKEVVMVFEEEYQYYFLFFSNHNDLDNLVFPEEILVTDLSEMADDCLVVVDTEGYVQNLTRPFAEFLGVDKESSIGKHVTEVIENTRMHIVAKTGNIEVAEPQKIKKII